MTACAITAAEFAAAQVFDWEACASSIIARRRDEANGARRAVAVFEDEPELEWLTADEVETATDSFDWEAAAARIVARQRAFAARAGAVA